MNPVAEAPEHWQACAGCDTLHQRIDSPPAHVANCVCCGSPLPGGTHLRLHTPVALALAGLWLYVPANLLPVMRVTLLGETHEAGLLTGALALWRGGFPGVASLTLLVGSLLPLLRLLGLLYVLVPLLADRIAPQSRIVFRLNEHFTEWGMLEVYLLAMLIAVVKLREMVEIETGPGLWCFAGTVLVLVSLVGATPAEAVWRRLRGREDGR
jgi:paraquat-inducible protein A